MIDLDELDRLEALHREAQKDPCDRGATCTKKCWRNYPCCVRKDRDDVQFRNAAADALPELLRAARKAATMTSAEGVISSLKATLESRRREVVAVTAERDAARAGYRVLGQLPPRPVAELDLDDVRVCAANVADNYSSTCPPGSNAARILAALGAK